MNSQTSSLWPEPPRCPAPRYLNSCPPSPPPPACTCPHLAPRQFELERCMGKADTTCKSESDATILRPEKGQQEAKSCGRQPTSSSFQGMGQGLGFFLYVFFLLALFSFDPSTVFLRGIRAHNSGPHKPICPQSESNYSPLLV